MPGAARADDGHVNCQIGQCPGDRQLGDRGTELIGGNALQLADDLQVAPEGLALEHGALAAPVVGGEGCVLVHAAGQQPVGQRSVDEHPDVVLTGIRKDLGLGVAAEQVVGRLQRLHGPRACELGYLGRGVVGNADVPDRSLPDELLECRGGLTAKGTPGSGQCTW